MRDSSNVLALGRNMVLCVLFTSSYPIAFQTVGTCYTHRYDPEDNAATYRYFSALCKGDN